MSQIERISSKRFWQSGFVIQTEVDQFFIAEGPFDAITLDQKNFDHYSKTNTVLIKPDFWDFLSSAAMTVLKPNVKAFISSAEFKKLVQDSLPVDEPAFSKVRWSTESANDFDQQFQAMQNLISQGILQKAVPIGLMQADLQKPFQPEIYMNKLIADQNASGWIYGYWDQNTGILGRTPELLFKTKHDEKSSNSTQSTILSTMALAGTWPKSEKIENNFEDPKIWNEHQIVVEDIKKQMAEFCCVLQSPTSVVELKSLFHLKTELRFQIEQTEQIFKVLLQLHPTAALGLYPRTQDNYKKIQALPLQKQRESFGAPFGMVSPGFSHVVVAIRGLIWTEKKLKLYAGCGITKESELQAEYKEILLKMASVKKMLGLNE